VNRPAARDDAPSRHADEPPGSEIERAEAGRDDIAVFAQKWELAPDRHAKRDPSAREHEPCLRARRCAYSVAKRRPPTRPSQRPSRSTNVMLFPWLRTRPCAGSGGSGVASAAVATTTPIRAVIPQSSFARRAASSGRLWTAWGERFTHLSTSCEFRAELCAQSGRSVHRSIRRWCEHMFYYPCSLVPSPCSKRTRPDLAIAPLRCLAQLK
jgi:hypothetical protein